MVGVSLETVTGAVDVHLNMEPLRRRRVNFFRDLLRAKRQFFCRL